MPRMVVLRMVTCAPEPGASIIVAPFPEKVFSMIEFSMMTG
jgi:hypothetical protein